MADKNELDIAKMSEEEREKYFELMPLDKTSTLLIMHLSAEPESIARNKIIKMAHDLLYDDYKSPYPAPKRQLYDDLHEAGFPHLAQNVVNGEYD